MIGFTNPDLGLGYSVPAEGYLNFGIVGLLIACFTVGTVLAWTHSRARWGELSIPAIIYPLALSLLPVLLRSDALGLTKLLAYPLIAAAIILALARSVRSNLSWVTLAERGRLQGCDLG